MLLIKIISYQNIKANSGMYDLGGLGKAILYSRDGSTD